MPKSKKKVLNKKDNPKSLDQSSSTFFKLKESSRAKSTYSEPCSESESECSSSSSSSSDEEGQVIFPISSVLDDLKRNCKGKRGKRGCQGFQGAQGGGNGGGSGGQGPTGYQGLMGAQGLNGLSLQGDTGYQGFPGQQGDPGVTGYQGYSGYQGAQGSDGQGYQGDTGYQGFTGQQGDLGLTGYQGFTGQQGDLGLTGYQGYSGYQGLIGAQGANGPVSYNWNSINSSGNYTATPNNEYIIETAGLTVIMNTPNTGALGDSISILGEYGGFTLTSVYNNILPPGYSTSRNIYTTTNMICDSTGNWFIQSYQ